MTSPVVTKIWNGALRSLPVLGILGVLLATAGTAVVDTRIDKKIKNHEASSASHLPIINLEKAQAVMAVKQSNIEANVKETKEVQKDILNELRLLRIEIERSNDS